MIYATTEYLYMYICGGYGSNYEEVRKVLIEELRYFLTHHPDSIYSPVISQALEKYEAEDSDAYHTRYVHNMKFLFNNIESELKFDVL